jgi:hypothetical protein
MRKVPLLSSGSTYILIYGELFISKPLYVCTFCCIIDSCFSFTAGKYRTMRFFGITIGHISYDHYHMEVEGQTFGEDSLCIEKYT